MRKIIAIGGGEIGRPGTKIETLSIDKEIIKLSGKKKPNLLFIPTASSDSESYCGIVNKYFGAKLKCKVDNLLLLNKKLSKKELEAKIFWADIIYVGGGNTLRMMKIWKKHNLDSLLKKASEKGIVLSGLSAGAICWFQFGNSDSLSFTNKKAPLIKVKGLGLVDALICPHYDVEKKRRLSLKNMLKGKKYVGLALQNCVAIEIVDSKYRIISSKKNVFAYKTFWQKGIYVEEKIPISKNFIPLKSLLSKS